MSQSASLCCYEFALSWMSLLVMTRGLLEATCRVFHYGFVPLQQLKEPIFFSSAALRNALLEEITSSSCHVAEKLLLRRQH